MHHCFDQPKNTKAAKQHRCYFCDQLIHKGEMHMSWSGVEFGEGYWRCRMHPECLEAYSKMSGHDQEDHQPGYEERPEPAPRSYRAWPNDRPSHKGYPSS